MDHNAVLLFYLGLCYCLDFVCFSPYTCAVSQIGPSVAEWRSNSSPLPVPNSRDIFIVLVVLCKDVCIGSGYIALRQVVTKEVRSRLVLRNILVLEPSHCGKIYFHFPILLHNLIRHSRKGVILPFTFIPDV